MPQSSSFSFLKQWQIMGIDLPPERSPASPRAQHDRVNLHSKCIRKITNWGCVKTPKSSINQMVKCSKKLINQLTKWVNVTKIHRIKATEMGGVSCMSAYYLKFYFPPRIHAHIFAQENYKKLQNIFNVVTKQRQN